VGVSVTEGPLPIGVFFHPFRLDNRTYVRYGGCLLPPGAVEVWVHDDTDALINGIDAFHSHISGAQRGLFRLIAEADRREAWQDSGARDMAHWLSMRQGISTWKAHRWIAAAHAFEQLPRLSEAFSSGELGIDKVIELTRFATAKTEAGLVRWAKGVSTGCIRRRADAACTQVLEQVQDAEHARFCRWWWTDEGRRLGLEAELPAAQGAVVAKTLERLASEVPPMPGEDDPCSADARRADGLVALCSARISSDPDPDRATVVVHAPLEALLHDRGGAELESGGVLHPETARRLLCDARVGVVVEDDQGRTLGMGRLSREPSAAMVRQLRFRDRECRFPSCGTRRFTQAHHVRWWRHGGRTDLDNLVLLCSFHHKLVHELGWVLKREDDGVLRWFRPDGTRYRAGPDPPRETAERQPALAAAGF
jgi:hypothetical protein